MSNVFIFSLSFFTYLFFVFRFSWCSGMRSLPRVSSIFLRLLLTEIINFHLLLFITHNSISFSISVIPAFRAHEGVHGRICFTPFTISVLSISGDSIRQINHSSKFPHHNVIMRLYIFFQKRFWIIDSVLGIFSRRAVVCDVSVYRFFLFIAYILNKNIICQYLIICFHLIIL